MALNEAPSQLAHRMPKIENITLGCLAPSAQRQFYCTVLGMSESSDGSVGYGALEARLQFQQAKRPYQPLPQDLYWKIAIAVPDIDLACRQLTALGVAVDAPRQFLDVGHLAHFKDPEGFTIELIEHWFAGARQAEPIDSTRLGGGAHLNLLTLRTANIQQVRQTCEGWNMKPLSVQPVSEHGFTLYFFAFTDDEPPSPDLSAVENRPWLYQRRYTVLEVQYRHADTGAVLTQPTRGDAGYLSTRVSGLPEARRGHNDLGFEY